MDGFGVPGTGKAIVSFDAAVRRGQAMTIENWTTGPHVDGGGDCLAMSVPADRSASRVLCYAVQGAAAALGGRGVGENARQAVSAACSLLLGEDGVGGRLTVRITADSDGITAEVVGELPRRPSHDPLDADLAERLLSGYADRWIIEPASLHGRGSPHRVWLQLHRSAA
jgi:hypothetical protein